MTDVEQIKEKLDVAEVVGSYIQLKQAGRNLKAPCPFHHEKTASFMVSPDKGIWHCFGCNEGGDVFKFVMKYEGVDFRGALEMLAARAGVELKPRTAADEKAQKELERLQQATKWAVRYYQESLVKNRAALEYAAKRRGLKKETIRDFQIGYAPDDWNALGHFLVKKNFTAAELKKAGLVGQKAGRSSVYDLFRGRLMFTICDAQGNPVGFTGRVLDDEQQPKYLNTPQTPLYDKSRVIFGLHLAKEAIRSSDEVVLVEGNMDVVSSHQAGVKQVVAVSGTALTLDQLKALSRVTRNLKICFDADAAGLRATERAIELSQSLPITLSVVRLAEGKDPDDLIQKSATAWRQAIARAKYAVDYLFDQLAATYDLSTATGKRQYSDRLIENLRRLQDPVERDHYIKLLADRVGSTEAAIRQKLERSEAKNPESLPELSKPAATRVEPKTKPSKQLLEESVLAVNLAYPEVRLSLDDLTPAHFSDSDHQIIVETLQRAGQASVEQVAGHLPNQSDYVKILSLRGEEEYGSFAPADRSLEAFELVRRLQIASNKDTQTKLRRKMREAQESGDTQLVRKLLAQYQALVGDDS
jgi:DNA primase